MLNTIFLRGPAMPVMVDNLSPAGRIFGTLNPNQESRMATSQEQAAPTE